MVGTPDKDKKNKHFSPDFKLELKLHEVDEGTPVEPGVDDLVRNNSCGVRLFECVPIFSHGWFPSPAVPW